jgi:hypothetical protein
MFPNFCDVFPEFDFVFFFCLEGRDPAVTHEAISPSCIRMDPRPRPAKSFSLAPEVTRGVGPVGESWPTRDRHAAGHSGAPRPGSARHGGAAAARGPSRESAGFQICQVLQTPRLQDT